jgi:hypothetical protein
MMGAMAGATVMSWRIAHHDVHPMGSAASEPPIERHALDAAGQAHARLESRQSMGLRVLVA